MSTATDTALTTVYWGTNYAGQIVGVTDSNAANGVSQNPLAINCQLNINSSNDLSSIIVANSGGSVKTIQYVNDRAPPRGVGAASLGRVELPGQAARAGKLTRGSSLSGAMVSSVM
jgi:hypothetical protein